MVGKKKEENDEGGRAEVKRKKEEGEVKEEK